MPGSIGLMVFRSIALRHSGCVPSRSDGKLMSPGSFIASTRRSTSIVALLNGTWNGSGLPLSAVFTAGTVQTRRLRSMSVQRIGGLASPFLLTPMMSPVRQAVSTRNSSARAAIARPRQRHVERVLTGLVDTGLVQRAESHVAEFALAGDRIAACLIR